jgi:pimeloyl-ACP methyl ester carboxylesterase
MPVVLIHGALRSRAGLAPVAWYLRRFGLDARPFGYDTRGASLEAHGEALERFIDEWRGARAEGEAGLPRLGILTHSMGGLVARAYLARRGAQAQSARQRLVMLAPPNRGAWLAQRFRDFAPFRWLYGAAAEELLPERAAELPVPPPSADVLIIAGGRGDERGYLRAIPGDNDGLVGVDETHLPGIAPVMVRGAHSLLQWRRDVLRDAARFLVDGPSPE